MNPSLFHHIYPRAFPSPPSCRLHPCSNKTFDSSVDLIGVFEIDHPAAFSIPSIIGIYMIILNCCFHPGKLASPNFKSGGDRQLCPKKRIKKKAAASAGFCKNSRLRLWFLFQFRSPVRFVYDTYCFCIAHSIGRPLPSPLSDPLPER